MEASILKILSDAGLGLGALIALVIVVIYQLKYMEKMGKSIEENTSATKELTTAVREFRETDKDVIKAVEYCKSRQDI